MQERKIAGKQADIAGAEVKVKLLLAAVGGDVSGGGGGR
jgi:hypothetical protein